MTSMSEEQNNWVVLLEVNDRGIVEDVVREEAGSLFGYGVNT